MTSAFQANAFQVSAFQIEISASASAGLGSGGGGPWARRGGGRRRRSVDFEKIYEVIDRANARTQKERRAAFDRIDKAIEAAINGVVAEAKEIDAPEPAAVVSTARAISKDLLDALTTKPASDAPRVDVEAMRGRLEFLERQVKAVQKSHELRLRAIEEDDEDIILLMSH